MTDDDGNVKIELESVGFAIGSLLYRQIINDSAACYLPIKNSLQQYDENHHPSKRDANVGPPVVLRRTPKLIFVALS